MLYVGDGADYTAVAGQLNWAIVSAAKDPWHRAALGYTTPGCPKDHPEYLFARRGDHLILNMVDADDPKYFAPAMVNEALAFVWDSLDAGIHVLIHCNQGESRAPSLALLYLLETDPEYQRLSLPAARALFETVYPAYSPRPGIWGYVEANGKPGNI